MLSGVLKKLSGSRDELGRVARFCLVGVLNTLIDFSVLNVAHFKFGIGLIAANLISTTTAMIFSFIVNRNLVFKAKNGQLWKQALLFVLITASSIYVLQSVIFWLFSHPLENFTLRSIDLVKIFLPSNLSHAVIMDNAIKIVATVASLIWNYVLYKKVVFIQKVEKHVEIL